jgi:hypothetical protein
MSIKSSELDDIIAKARARPKIEERTLDDIIAKNRAMLEEKAPALASISEEDLKKITERALATTTARTTPECIAACLSGEEAVGVYCDQILKGPDLSDITPLTAENIGRQWARQSIRCISQSVLEGFHPGTSRRQRSVLPLDEAKRLAEIVNKKLTRNEANEAHEFWLQAKQELDDYIGAWSETKKRETFSAWA